MRGRRHALVLAKRVEARRLVRLDAEAPRLPAGVLGLLGPEVALAQLGPAAVGDDGQVEGLAVHRGLAEVVAEVRHVHAVREGLGRHARGQEGPEVAVQVCALLAARRLAAAHHAAARDALPERVVDVAERGAAAREAARRLLEDAHARAELEEGRGRREAADAAADDRDLERRAHERRDGDRGRSHRGHLAGG